MRYDLFTGRKSIHIKLTKEIHAALKEKLFKYGITMQDLFHEAALQALSESDKADRLLEKVAKKKMREEIEKLKFKSDLNFGEFDRETLYNLIEDSNED